MPTPSSLLLASTYHQPVILKQALDNLAIKPQGTYIDLTFGGGSYSKAILQTLSPNGRLLAFDQDHAAITQANPIQDTRFTFIQGNFRFLQNFLTSYQIQAVDGIIADLGISSHQLNTSQRGFAARLHGPLDMRMNQQTSLTASQIINTYSLNHLTALLKQYGEIHNAPQLAKTILTARKHNPITTTTQLKQAIHTCLPKRYENKYYAKLFQALRIEVNDELGALKELLMQTPNLLNPQGRLVILSYHSLEDRLVKNFIKTGNFEGKIIQDLYGNLIRPLAPVHNKVIKPNDEEIAKNNRARSARLRTATLIHPK